MATKTITIKEINELQSLYGLTEIQELINTGLAWRMEGSIGREAMSNLKSGACYLPKKSYTDYYGNKVPSRDELKPFTQGTITNSKRFWIKTLEE